MQQRSEHYPPDPDLEAFLSSTDDGTTVFLFDTPILQKDPDLYSNIYDAADVSEFISPVFTAFGTSPTKNTERVGSSPGSVESSPRSPSENSDDEVEMVNPHKRRLRTSNVSPTKRSKLVRSRAFDGNDVRSLPAHDMLEVH